MQERETMERNWLKLMTLVLILGYCAGCEKKTDDAPGGQTPETPKTINLITSDLSNFTFEGGRWTYQDGVVARTGEGELNDLWINGQ